MKDILVIIGAGGHGKVVADIAEKSQQWGEILFLDDNPTIKYIGKYKVSGVIADINRYDNAKFIVAIGNNIIRQDIQSKLEDRGFSAATLVHPSAVIAADVDIGPGSAIMAGAIVNSSVKIGKGCIINTASSIDHDCIIEGFVHVSPGVHLAGNVIIGAKSWLGLGSLVVNNLCVCSDSTIGAGAVIIHNIDKSGTYVGVPARKTD